MTTLKKVMRWFLITSAMAVCFIGALMLLGIDTQHSLRVGVAFAFVVTFLELFHLREGIKKEVKP